MQELRLLGVSEDGSSLLLAADDGERLSLPINDELRSTIRRDRREPASPDGQAKVENPLRPRDVQGLIRGGVPLEEIAERAGWSLEKVQRYEGPIRAERDYVSELAQRVQLYGRGETTTLRERADHRLAERGVEAERVVWDSWKNDDAHWTVIVRFPAGGRQREATWLFDPVNRSLRTVDDEARWLGGDEIASADEDAPQRRKAVERKRSGGSARALRPANVYDVEAEGGLADAQGPHLGAAIAAKDEGGKPADLTASMRARQASRGRSKSSSSSSTRPAARPTSLPGSAPEVTRVERLDLGTTPPPAPSHPRPEELDDDSSAAQAEESNARRADAGVTKLPPRAAEQSHDTDDEQGGSEPTQQSSSSRRRKSRRSRASVETAPVRSALQTDDTDQDESLFGELPGFHDGGSGDVSDESQMLHAVDDDAADTDEFAAEADDATETTDADATATSTDESSEPVQEESLFDEDVAEASDEAEKPSPVKDRKDTTVPQRASQSRKSGRPSVPSWDDIMFGGRGPKK